MIRIPEPPRRPLAAPGDVLEGRVIDFEQGIAYGKPAMTITLQTTNGPYALACNRRLWDILAALGELDRIRITRLDDSPAVGNQSPGRNYQVEKLPGPITVPPSPAAPQHTTQLAW